MADGIPVGKLVVTLTTEVDQASRRNAISQITSDARGSTGTSGGARVSPGADAAVSRLPRHLQMGALDATTGLPGQIGSAVNTSVAGKVGTGGLSPDVIKDYVSQRAVAQAGAAERFGGTYGAINTSIAGKIGTGGLGPNLIGDYVSQRTATATETAGEATERNALVNQFRKGRREFTSQESERHSAVSSFRHARDQDILRGGSLESFGATISRQQQEQASALGELAQQEQDITRAIKDKVQKRRTMVDRMRAGWQTARTNNVMSTGSFMNVLFGGWEVNTAFAISSQADSVARGAGPNLMAGALAQQEAVRGITRGPMGSFLGSAFRSEIEANEAVVRSAGAGLAIADSMAERRIYGEQAGIRAGIAGSRGVMEKAGRLDLTFSQQRAETEKRRLEELALESRNRFENAESARTRAIAKDKRQAGVPGLVYELGRGIEENWLGTYNVGDKQYNDELRDNKRIGNINARYAAIRGMQGAERFGGGMELMRELGGEFGDWGKTLAGMARGGMRQMRSGVQGNFLDMLMSHSATMSGLNALPGIYGMMGKDPLGAQLAQIDQQSRDARHATRFVPGAGAAIDRGAQAYKNYATQQFNNNTELGLMGLGADLSVSLARAGGKNYSAQALSIFHAADIAAKQFRQKGQDFEAGMSLQIGLANLSAFKRELLDAQIGSGVSGSAFRTDFSGRESRPQKENVKEALATVEDLLRQIRDNSGIQ